MVYSGFVGVYKQVSQQHQSLHPLLNELKFRIPGRRIFPKMKSYFCILLGLAVTAVTSMYTPNIEETLPLWSVKEQEEGTTETDLPLVSVEGITPQIVPLYQYWNSDVSDHFYTQSIQEIGITVPGKPGLHGYIAQGVACLFLSASDGTAVPLYQYYLGGPNADHFYTTNADEIGTTTVGQAGNNGYVYDGVAGYCYKTQVPGTFPLYRFYGGRNDHFYTKGSLPHAVAGYKYEGIQCYVY